MHGNVWEWVQDWYREYAPEPVTDPQGPASGTRRVARGGCCGGEKSKRFCQSAARASAEPGHGDERIGFRLLRRRGEERAAAPQAEWLDTRKAPGCRYALPCRLPCRFTPTAASPPRETLATAHLCITRIAVKMTQSFSDYDAPSVPYLTPWFIKDDGFDDVLRLIRVRHFDV